MIDKGIEACRGMNVDLGYGAVEEVLQGAARLVPYDYWGLESLGV